MNDESIVPSRFTVSGVLLVFLFFIFYFFIFNFAVMRDLNNCRIIHRFAMKIWCDSSIDVSNSLIKMYGKCKCIEDALEIFEMMQGKDIFSCNSVVSIHEECGDHDGTLRLLDRMLGAKIQPDLVTVTTVLLACSHLVVLMHGREIHGYMIVSGLGKDGKCIDDVLPKMHLMHSHCLQNPLVYVMPLGIQRCFLKLKVNIKLTFKTFPYCQFSLNH